MQVAYTQILEMVSRKPLGKDHENVLTILKELERVGIVRSEVIDLHTEKWYTLTEEA